MEQQTRLYFTKQFTKGLLKGQQHTSSLGFVSPEAAVVWVKAIESKSRRGRLPYRLVDRSFQNYTR